MFRTLLSTRILATLAVLLGLGFAQLSIPSAVAAPYPPRAVTNTDLRLDKNRVNPGESNTARVNVTSDAGTPQGSVTFKVSGHAAESVPLVNGQASYSMPTDLRAGQTYRVTARYNGRRLYKPSQDTEYVTVRSDEVAGSENSRGAQGGDGDNDDDKGGSANRSGPTEGQVKGAEGNEGVLPSTGSDATTQLVALTGLGLLGAGAALMLYRRRVRS